MQKYVPEVWTAWERPRCGGGVRAGPRGTLVLSELTAVKEQGQAGVTVPRGAGGALAALGGHPWWAFRPCRAQPCVTPAAKPALPGRPGVVPPSPSQCPPSGRQESGRPAGGARLGGEPTQTPGRVSIPPRVTTVAASILPRPGMSQDSGTRDSPTCVWRTFVYDSSEKKAAN